jgi:TolA-binding protein
MKNNTKNKIKNYTLLFSFFLIISCAYYNTMFNAFKTFDEGNLKIANSRDGKINAEIRKTFNSTIDKCWMLLNTYSDSSDWADDAFLLIGKSYYLIEEYSKANRFLDQFIKKYPKSELLNEAKIWYAKVLVKTEDDEKALIMLNEMLVNEMDDELKAEALSSIGSIYYLREEYEEAINKLNECIEISGDDILSATSQHQIGKIYFDLGQNVNAIENFNYVLDYNPPEELEFNTLMNKVDAQIKLDKLDLALKTLSQMLRNSKIKDKHSLVEAKMGECYVLQEKQEYATEHFYDVLKRYPKSLGSAWSTFQIAELLENYFFDADSARKMFLKVKQESGQSEYVEQSTKRASLLKKYLDLKTNISKNQEDIQNYTQMLLDTTITKIIADTLTDSLATFSSVSDTDSVLVPEKKETKESITKKLQDAENSLAKNRYNLAEFFLLSMQDYDSSAAAYINFIDTGLDTTRIPKAYHALSYIYNYKLTDSTLADSVDKIIIEKFPDSQYSDFILTRNSPVNTDEVIEENPMKIKYLIAEQYLFDDSLYSALDTLGYIAENDSGNEWGGKARYAISWIYENKIKDINKALESYTKLAEEYPKSEFAKIAKNKIKIPKVEVPVDTTKSDSLQIGNPETQDDEEKGEEEIIQDKEKDEGKTIEYKEKEDEESEVIDEEKEPFPYGLNIKQEEIESIKKGLHWNRYLA